MTEPTFDADDEALLEQAVRGLREDLPDDERARRLDRIVTDYLEANAEPPRRRQPWRLGLAAGAVIAIAASAFLAARREAPPSLAPPATPAPTLPSAPSVEPPATPTAAPTAMPTPIVSVDALPTAHRKAAVDVKTAKTARVDRAFEAEEPGDELALLEEARSALAKDPARTIALADSHAKRFPKPLLAQERERLAIDALVRLGRRADAETRAKAFEATFPDSPHIERVRALVAPKVAP